MNIKQSRIIKILIACGLFTLYSCSKNNKLQEVLTDAASKYTAANNPPGMAIAILKNGKQLWSYSYGYSDLNNKLSFDSSTIMNIASVSKTITSTAVLQLWEIGKIDLDTDINNYLDFSVRNPNYKNTPITIRQLLTHTASIADGDSYAKSYQCGISEVSLANWIRNYFKEDGKYYNEANNFYDWEPGERYKYSNVAYGLLGLIVEVVGEQSFSSYCKENIFDPLKMNSSGWFRKDIDTLKQSKQYVLAKVSHENDYLSNKLIKKRNKGFYELCNYSFYNYPDGLCKTSVQELSFFMSAMMNKGQFDTVQILKASTLDMALSLQLRDNNIQGLGWKRISYENFTLWGHSGRDPGVRTHMYFDPKTKIGIILFQNNDEGSTLGLIEKLYTLVNQN